ncbi:MAG: polyprenyl synthetase family protein [Clostridia bacterium]|nr:polyprenyl synthetase family protein [Clostridia bacterium]
MIDKINRRMNELIDNMEGIHENLKDSMKYSVNAGGKRLRPMLLLEVFKGLADDDADNVLDYACAIEMIHTYSLIHDDLPAMDNDSLRRNKPTNHIVFGEDMAILAGDALLNTAMEILIRLIENEETKKASALIASSSGVSGMISGQVYDMKKAESVTELEHIHRLKTGDLIKCALVAGAVLAKADSKTIEKLSLYGENIGLAFQIRDDILDVTGNEAVIGKPVHSDEKNNKSTYVSFYGIIESEKILQDKVREALKAIEGISIPYLQTLADFITESDR